MAQLSANATKSDAPRAGNSRNNVCTTSRNQSSLTQEEDLPPGWQKMEDEDGRVYYADHASKTTTYERPTPRQGQLPPGWEVARNPEGIAYFLDHNTHTTTFDDPRAA